MRLTTAVLATVLASLLLGTAPAQACSVVAPGPTEAELFRASDLAFYGRVLSVRAVPDEFDEFEATVRVDRVYRGRLGSKVEVSYTTSDGECGTSLKEGRRVGLLLDEPGPPYRIGVFIRISLGGLERATPDRCAGGRGRETLAANRLVRVFQGRKGGYFSCSKRTGRLTRLGPPDAGGLDLFFLRNFRVAGSVVAFSRARIAYRGKEVPSPLTETIVVRDLSTPGPPTVYQGQERRGPYDEEAELPIGVSDLVIDRRGRAAWIIGNPFTEPTQLQVYKQDERGRTLLDGGELIGRTSLELRAGGLSWRNGTATRTARLAP